MFSGDEEKEAEVTFQQTYPECPGLNPLTLLSVWPFTRVLPKPDSDLGRQWFDCAECHREQQPDHELMKSDEVVSSQKTPELGI